MELNPQTGMTVILEDFGQDFTEFDIDGGQIIATRPFQGFVWNGRKVLNEQIEAGTALWLNSTIDPEKMCLLKYPVVAVKPLTSVLATISYPVGSLGEPVEV